MTSVQASMKSNESKVNNDVRDKLNNRKQQFKIGDLAGLSNLRKKCYD